MSAPKTGYKVVGLQSKSNALNHRGQEGNRKQINKQSKSKTQKF